MVSGGGLVGNYSIKGILMSAFHPEGLCVFHQRNVFLFLPPLKKKKSGSKQRVEFLHLCAVEGVQHHLEVWVGPENLPF